MGKERSASDDRVDGGETIGKYSLGRAPWGRSDERVDGGETGKPWEIAWGELRGEGAIRKRREGGRRGNRGKKHGGSSGGKERYGSDDKVDGRETVGVGKVLKRQ